MNKSESKYYNTAVLMDQVLLALLEKKDYDFITVKEICEKAGVNRSTFYLHYESIGDLLEESLAYVMEHMRSYFDAEKRITKERIETCSLEELVLVTEEYLIPYLEFVKENQKIFRTAISQPSALKVNDIFVKMSAEVFVPIMRRFGFTETEGKYRLAFYVNGIFSVVSEWVKLGCREDTQYIFEVMTKCMKR